METINLNDNFKTPNIIIQDTSSNSHGGGDSMDYLLDCIQKTHISIKDLTNQILKNEVKDKEKRQLQLQLKQKNNHLNELLNKLSFIKNTNSMDDEIMVTTSTMRNVHEASSNCSFQVINSISPPSPLICESTSTPVSEISDSIASSANNCSELSVQSSPASSCASISSYSSTDSTISNVSSSTGISQYPKQFKNYQPSNYNVEERNEVLQIVKLIHLEHGVHVKDKTGQLDNIMYNLNFNPTTQPVANNNLQKKLSILSNENCKKYTTIKSPEETYLASQLDEDELSNYYSHSFFTPKALVSKPVQQTPTPVQQPNANVADKNSKIISFEKVDPTQFLFKKEKVVKLPDPSDNDDDRYYSSFHCVELIDEDMLVYDQDNYDTLNDECSSGNSNNGNSSTSTSSSSSSNSTNPTPSSNSTVTSPPILSPPVIKTNSTLTTRQINGVNNNHNNHTLNNHNNNTGGNGALLSPNLERKQHFRSLSHGIIKTPFTNNQLKTLSIFVPTEPYTCRLEITIEENVSVERLIIEVIDLCIKERRKIHFHKRQKLQVQQLQLQQPSTANNGLIGNGGNGNKNTMVSPPISLSSSSTNSNPATSNVTTSFSPPPQINSLTGGSTNSNNNTNSTNTTTGESFDSLTFPFLIYTNHRDFILRKSDENGEIDQTLQPVIRSTEIRKLRNGDCFSLVIHPKAIRDTISHPQIFRVHIVQSPKLNGKFADNLSNSNGTKNSVAVVYKSSSTLCSIKASICKKEKLELNLCVFMTMNNEVIQNEKITLIELNLPSIKLVHDQIKPTSSHHHGNNNKSVSFVSEVGNAPRPITKLLGPIFFFTPDNICEIKQYIISKINKLGVKKDRYMEINKDKIIYSPIDYIPSSTSTNANNLLNSIIQPGVNGNGNGNGNINGGVGGQVNGINGVGGGIGFNGISNNNSNNENGNSGKEVKDGNGVNGTSGGISQLLQQTSQTKNNKFFRSFSSTVIKTPYQLINDITSVGIIINKPNSFYLKCNNKSSEYSSSDSDEIVAKIQFIIRLKKENLI